MAMKRLERAIESVHARLRKIIKVRGHFPTEEAATKLTWLALRNIKTVWKRPPIHWTEAMNRFAILLRRPPRADRTVITDLHTKNRTRPSDTLA